MFLGILRVNTPFLVAVQFSTQMSILRFLQELLIACQPMHQPAGGGQAEAEAVVVGVVIPLHLELVEVAVAVVETLAGAAVRGAQEAAVWLQHQSRITVHP
jgi:hypothetical protein